MIYTYTDDTPVAGLLKKSIDKVLKNDGSSADVVQLVHTYNTGAVSVSG